MSDNVLSSIGSAIEKVKIEGAKIIDVSSGGITAKAQCLIPVQINLATTSEHAKAAITL